MLFPHDVCKVNGKGNEIHYQKLQVSAYLADSGRFLYNAACKLT